VSGGVFRGLGRAAALVLAAVLAWALPAAHGATPLPTDKGLPVVVRTAVAFTAIEGFDDVKGTFEATTDLRLHWQDLRLRYDTPRPNSYRHFRASAAQAELDKMWSPQIRFINRVGEATFTEPRLKLYPDGSVELVIRTTAVYKTPVDFARFPFDHQPLRIDVALREDTVESVDLDFSKEDVEFSRVARSVELPGWEPGLINLRRTLISGGNGYRYPLVSAELDVRRVAGGTLATIFIPLFASLLIPFLATWMNRSDEGEFAVDAFELANVIIGGLFAVIALSFSVASSFPGLAGSDNTVNRLIGLNYLALAVGLIIAVVFYRYNLPRRWFGPYVQHQMFQFLTWAFPFLFVSIGLIFVLMAAA
jgi:hypothetical protein